MTSESNLSYLGVRVRAGRGGAAAAQARARQQAHPVLHPAGGHPVTLCVYVCVFICLFPCVCLPWFTLVQQLTSRQVGHAHSCSVLQPSDHFSV